MTDLDKEVVRNCAWCKHDGMSEHCLSCYYSPQKPNYEPPAEVLMPAGRDRVAELQAEARKAEFDWAGADAMIAEAVRITSTDRHDQYAPPEDNFANIARVWTALLGHEVSAADVARCMIGVKLVRDAYKPKRDNRVDGVGYWRTLERVEPTDE